MFQRLHDHNLKLKASKCEFFKREVSYLGHIVSESGIKTDPEKIKAVAAWPKPTSIREVRRFLGLHRLLQALCKGFLQDCASAERSPHRPLHNWK